LPYKSFVLMIFLEAKQVLSGKSPCSVSGQLQSSFEDIGGHC
jgi:hypothetical protein